MTGSWGLFGITEIPDHANPDTVYLWRLRIIETPFFGVKLHHIRMSDDPQTRGLHDHPWPFLSIRLRRNYTELRPGPTFYSDWSSQGDGDIHMGDDYVTKRRRFWSITRTSDMHAVRLDDEERGCWTLVFNGRRCREWGFRFPGQPWMPWHQLDGPHARNVRGNAGSVK